MTFLTVGDILALHEEVVKASGGSAGVRDMGAVESAVAQPQAAFGGQELYPTLAAKAAALSFSLVKNHAFVDGNKRIGWAAMRVFLRLNGSSIATDVDEAERAVLSLAAGEMSREEWTQWVRGHLMEYK
jgi:death-on-curing protein